MRKILKLFMFIGILSSLFLCRNVKAENVNLSIENTNLFWTRTNRFASSQSGKFNFYKFNDRIAYCVENGIIEGDTYQTGDFSLSSLDNNTKEKLMLIAYYGYEYEGHQTLNYRLATQVLMWETSDGFNNTVVSTERNKNGTIYDLTNEKNEILNLVNSHYTKPSFNGMLFQGEVGKEIVINDTNNVLNKYYVVSSNGADVRIEGNNLIVVPKTTDEIEIRFLKRMYTDRTYLVYYAGNKQTMMSAGFVDPVASSVKVKASGGEVTINKVDKDTDSNNPGGDATLEGAIYEIYDEFDNYIETLTTNEEGIATSNKFNKLGKYYVVEKTPSKGYQLDDTKYYFEMTLDNLNPVVKVYEKIISVDYEFTKVYADDKTGIMTPEANVTFGIFNSKDELVKQLTTDNNGRISFNLVYGDYTLKQLTTTHNYEKIDDLKINVKENSDKVYKVLGNAEIKAKLKVVKIDADTKEVIKRSGIKFKIYSIDNDDYVCQTISYPNKQTICEWETDENGEFITAYPLKSGKYKLEEVDQKIDGYLWNRESTSFEIGEDGNLVQSELGIIFETNFQNKQVKGSVKITKKGEDVTLTDEGYIFDEKVLEGVKFGLYANENIISNGKIIYTKDEKIADKVTDKLGNITFNNLYLGKYYIKELETLDNYVLDDNKYEFDLIYKDQYTDIITYKNTLMNKIKTGKLEFTKTDISESKSLPDTLMEIYTIDDELVFSGRTDSEGKIIIDRLPLGKYYILEKEAPIGYKINEDKMYFEIKENGEVIKSTMKDEDITGTLEFTKIDFSTSEPLPNTLIEIYREDNNELIFSGRTDEFGKIVIEKLKYGKYYILEKEAPIGYEINDEKMYFEILEDGGIVKSEMKDEKIIEVPNTLKNDYKIIYLSTCTLIGAGIVIYGIYKSKKK